MSPSRLARGIAHRFALLKPAEIRKRLAAASLVDWIRIRWLMATRGPGGCGVCPVRAKPLGGRVVQLRRGSSDAAVFWDTFVGAYHLPPPAIDRERARVVWDLGANVGFTMAHYAMIFPNAQIFGVELDERMAEIARSHVKPWADRCCVIHGAVWHKDGEADYELNRGEEFGAHLATAVSAGRAGSGLRTRTFSLNTLFAECPVIDFVKMDIEGAEREVLKGPSEWARRVRAIKIEVHSPAYTVEECLRDLEALGFSVSRDTTHWSCVEGVRAPAP